MRQHGYPRGRSFPDEGGVCVHLLLTCRMLTGYRVEPGQQPEAESVRNGAGVLTLQRGLDGGQMVIAMAHRMVFQHELAGERSVVVERYRRGAPELVIVESADGR